MTGQKVIEKKKWSLSALTNITKFTSQTIYIITNDDMQLSSRIQLFSTALLFF